MTDTSHSAIIKKSLNRLGRRGYVHQDDFCRVIAKICPEICRGDCDCIFTAVGVDSNGLVDVEKLVDWILSERSKRGTTQLQKELAAISLLNRLARGFLGRKRVHVIKVAVGSVQPLPLPPVDVADILLERLGASGKKLVLLTGSNTLEQFFNAGQLKLFDGVFEAIAASSILRDRALMVGASAHGRAPFGKFETWKLRGYAFDNIVQERCFRAVGKERSLMLVFDGKPGEWTLQAPAERIINLGQSDGSFPKTGSLDEAEVTICSVCTPDISARPTQEPQQWQGVKSLAPIALIFGGGPRAAQLASARDGALCFTRCMPDAKQLLTKENYPYKPGSLFVFAAGGQPAAQVMASGPEQFRPSAVPESVWAKLTDWASVDFFTNTDSQAAAMQADPSVLERSVRSYAENVVQALEALVS